MKKEIKALLLAAGLGTRLRPITNSIPKCLVEIKGKPLLEIWLENLKKAKADEVLINTHYLSHKVEKFISLLKIKDLQISIEYEKELLGTAGILIKNKKFFKNSLGLLIHADNFTKLNLSEFLDAHNNRPKNCLITMLTFETNQPEKCGVVEIDKRNIVYIGK